ncbi:uncharacterized protein LOC114338034 isoform X1 [Diabrotica virgifera virgifera]|uniref:Chitin-binding type-2 domain-containing protein n=2 Tax=Diabrotica virgifera virgifera TaxID=50390 RepID=A0ABM5K6G7_DIAVI|nr:uncharacterized protein LOC114338034 isoform X1 [Diabrotica virgifera virgifera]
MILFSNIKISYVLELPGCTTMAFTVLFLSFLAVAFSNCYTITQDLLPIFPTQEIIGNNLVRHLPNGENVTIICPDDTILNKDTLTCDFKSQADSRNLVNEIKPCDNNCRQYELCDGGCVDKFCPPPLLFNKILEVCDYPGRANCCEFNAKNNSKILQGS